ncbi:uncharacterized protein LOC119079443 [Bradysia coprophila]|uniref:uncharacterized protein LOC119079443 n=1 Tax=Bradysia coprophila TaxID=38358 RepID=UPI00187D7C45|nr:uncharacterized protein LOC119079443 [Bradysia coprophila]
MRHRKASNMNNGIDSTNQLPNQPSNQLPNQLQNHLTNGNTYTGTNGSVNTSSTTSISSWLQNNPGGSSGSTPWSIQAQPQNQSQTHNTATSAITYRTYNNHLLPPLPHPLHFHTYGAPSSSSNAAVGNQQNNNNAQGGLFTIPTITTATLNNVTPAVSKKRFNVPSTDTIPKRPRGRPKKVKTTVSQAIVHYPPTATVTSATAISSAMGTIYNIRPAAFATLPSTAVFMPSMVLSSMPAASGMSLPAPSKYVPPMNSRPILTAAMPVPPNWLANMEESVMSLLTFNKYEIKEGTAEYQTISDMLYPISVKGVEQIVNPDLWDRFVKTRTDMMRSKADDLNILSKLGLSEKEVLRCAHLSLNFRKDPLIIPYSDNMVLLYHCTRSQTNVKSILSQGLDERLSNTSAGLLGKGIYFADDPNKSIQYDGTGTIFIFAVLLGDCISVDHFTNRHSFVREPEKVSQQKRNFNDQFFDSIVARPAGYNEYVIYNRYQCCPIYQVKYDRNTVAGGSASVFHSSSQKLPPIAWIPSGHNYAMPIQDQTINWPFFAVDIFTSMGVPPPTDDDGEDSINDVAQNTSQPSIDDNLVTLINLGYNDEAKNREILAKFNNDLDQAVNYYLDNENFAEDVHVNDTEATTIQDDSVNTSSTSEAEMLVTFGFCDKAKNRDVLAKFNNDVGQAINYFLDNANVEDASNGRIADKASVADKAVASTITNKSIVTIDLIDDDSDCPGDEETVDITAVTDSTQNSGTDLPDDLAEWALDLTEKQDQVEMEDCPICCNEISPSSWQILECKHKVCAVCYSKLLTQRSTMSGVPCTFVKCPFCHATFGTEVGTCPNMKMKISKLDVPCDGFTRFSTIVIEYVTQRLRRTAYLPDNETGREVLKLLEIAFERRLIFTVGTSNTTGQENVIVWNIHHKTARQGGVATYGYPDPEYFDRVKAELKTFGIE